MKQMFILCTVLALTAPVAAHHGNASTENKTVVMKATVVQWLWTNPHTFLKFDAKDDSGNVTQQPFKEQPVHAGQLRVDGEDVQGRGRGHSHAGWCGEERRADWSNQRGHAGQRHGDAL